MKNKLLSILVILSLILSMFILTACEDEEENDSEDSTKKTVQNEISLNDEVNKNIEEDEEETSLMSEEEAEELLKEYYDIAESLYFLSDDYFDIDMNGDGSEYALKYPINNYEEVINNYISKSFSKEFYPALLVEENGEYYLGIGGFAQGYENLRFEDIEVENGKISCTAILDVYVVDELIEKDAESNFEIVSENGTWKINAYTSFTELGY